MSLFLLPNVFDDTQSPHLLLPEGLGEIIATLDGLVAESERAGRRYLLKMCQDPRMRTLPIYVLNEHEKDVSELVNKVCAGEKLGLVSDAGMPSIADPGAALVFSLRKQGFTDIHAIPGPSSIFLALVLSGLGGQRFSFHGYLPRDRDGRVRLLRALERDAVHTKSAQICIEVPYRNKAFFSDCMASLKGTTTLCVASQLTYSDQQVVVLTIDQWKKKKNFELGKIPVVFIIK